MKDPNNISDERKGIPPLLFYFTKKKSKIIKKEPKCSDPRNSDMNLEGFTMSKLTKKDKIHIFEEWTLENK
ncbi:hypothetical protein, partial [Lactobacillus gallinarum]|uniref:hypothetical protein n=1 Tax=Lactobacillus gallinarum TaxID=52242 RepID=UPI001956809F